MIALGFSRVGGFLAGVCLWVSMGRAQGEALLALDATPLLSRTRRFSNITKAMLLPSARPRPRKGSVSRSIVS
jgi:hypothetical protein